MIPKSVLFFWALTKGGAAMLMFLWWVFVVGCVVWVAGIVWLFVLMTRDALKGDDIGLYEVVKTFAWPVIFAWTALIILLVASDDGLG